MSVEQSIFLIIAAVTLVAAALVVSVRNLVHAALWLVVALFGVAVTYAFLNAGFLAVAQVVIYIGAIAILMIFAITLTQRVADDSLPQFNPNWIWGGVLALVLFGGLGWLFVRWPGGGAAAAPIAPSVDSLRQLGEALVASNGYVLPFELASVLLLAALVGAIIVAWDRKLQ